MAHIPLIHGPDGSKLSKRHGALGVDAYRAMGYLPAAMRNYLVRLGWSHGDQEIFSTEEMIAAFDLPQIGRSPARFDFAKLESLNGHYMRASARRRSARGDRARCCRILPDGAELAGKLTPAVREQLMAAMPELKERAKTLVELIDGARASSGRPRRSRSTTRRRRCSRPRRAALLARDRPGAGSGRAVDRARRPKQAVRAYAERKGAKLGAVAQPLRAALTGRTTSPGIFDVLAVLGRQESLARLRDQAGLSSRLAHAGQLSPAAPCSAQLDEIPQLTRRFARSPPARTARAGSPSGRGADGSSRVRSWTRRPAPTPRPASLRSATRIGRSRSTTAPSGRR